MFQLIFTQDLIFLILPLFCIFEHFSADLAVLWLVSLTKYAFMY